jgi:hypothetical protein
MLNDVRGIVQGHPNRHNIENENITSPPPMERQEPDEADVRGRSRGRKDKGAIARLGEAFGIDLNDDDKTVDDDPNWKELKPGEPTGCQCIYIVDNNAGNYNYPISFTFPSDLPPSIDVDCGSVVYKLKAIVHRPGTFSTKISATTVVELVSSPGEEDSEDGESIVIERQWDNELRYLISIGGRNFPQGADVSLHLFAFVQN